MRERSWWGWGWADNALADSECVQLARGLPGMPSKPKRIPDPAALELPAIRLRPPAAVAEFCTTTPLARAAHTYGKAYRDVVRALAGRFERCPDLVAYPRTEGEIVAVLDWAGGVGAAVVPYGGGSSVVGGVEYRGELPWVCVDLSRLNQVLEIDRTSRAARVHCGILGPALEDRLRPHGLTLRHFPQSFEFSSLGGWLATRAGGHYSTTTTHIDDFVESLRVVTPRGISESRRLPGSGAGPSPDRLLLGSEGILGILTEAWMRLQDRPAHRASAAVTFPDFADGIAAVRAIVQSGLSPAGCRLLDAGEAALAGAARCGESVLILGFESPAHPVLAPRDAAVEIARMHGGTVRPNQDGADIVETWRSGFLRMPYLRDALARTGTVVETFETATTWDRLLKLYSEVHTEVAAAVERVCGAPGIVNCRLTHVYADGAAPYFTVLAPGRPGSELAMWDDIKAAASEVLDRHRATITHHHAVGRDHRPGYDRQRPDLFAEALRAVKKTVDPQGILNPGVLLD
ncbi:FAD-binding oxidoreductase [Amycolatopsis suaedae]|uniref:FAD-binding oxidoreductase n=1 Tax=Amycolatopsis suaedae TaxID=2510978 RepID=A0A4Q7JG79_9PSEU|nr:FAD-binding oxidoreductase [Amycolatopsis suaedae]RZQ65754.1 FAD-binding oxidoreductase [Amycolatopsis suaedae]